MPTEIDLRRVVAELVDERDKLAEDLSLARREALESTARELAAIDQRDAALAKLAAAMREDCRAALARVLAEDLLPARCLDGAEQTLDSLPLDLAAGLARRVLLHAFQGSEELALRTVSAAFEAQRQHSRLLIGADLVGSSLADATNLDVRTLNALERAGILTVGDLLSLRDVLPRLEIVNCREATFDRLAEICRQLWPRTAGAPLPPAPEVPLSRIDHVPAGKRTAANPGKAKFNPSF